MHSQLTIECWKLDHMVTIYLMQSSASLAYFNLPNQKWKKFFIKLQEYLLPVLTIFSIQETLLVGTQTSYFIAYRITWTPFIFCNSCNHYCLPCQVPHMLTCDLGFNWSSCSCMFCNTLHKVSPPLMREILWFLWPQASYIKQVHYPQYTLMEKWSSSYWSSEFHTFC